MASAPISHRYCEDCFTGVKHNGEPVGKTIIIGDIPTYVSEPPSSADGHKKVVLFFADVFGPFYLNNQLLQDYFARRDFDPYAWADKARVKAEEITPKWVEDVRKHFGTDSKYCAVGYCFGAPFVMNLACTDDIVAAAFAHPAFLNEDQFKNLKQTDFTFGPEFRRRAEDILAENKAQYQIQVFSGVTHGFATRGDPEGWAKEESARGIIGWFGRFAV
ncbi:hypothetical protein B0H14DRAFT_2758047 [Mycena olivaceomarginata]|nr:hypothetical protein B0H14DRAFT_2758047 [Mycena olivaceomarginata]